MRFVILLCEINEYYYCRCGLICAIISGAALVSSFYSQVVQVGNYSGSAPPIVSSLLSPAFNTIQMLLTAPGVSYQVLLISYYVLVPRY